MVGIFVISHPVNFFELSLQKISTTTMQEGLADVCLFMLSRNKMFQFKLPIGFVVSTISFSSKKCRFKNKKISNIHYTQPIVYIFRFT